MATLPAGQRTRNASTEADRTVWIAPADALDAYEKGELLMMPPTVSTLRQLGRSATAAAALAAAGTCDMTPVLAKARLEGDELVLSWPGHDEFTKRVGPADPGGGAGSDADPGAGPGGSAGVDAGRGEGESR